MKKLFTVLLTSLLVLCLFGCHGKQTEETAIFEVPEKFDNSRDYEITFWAKNDSNISQVEVYKDAISKFGVIYPNIHITLKLYTDYTKIYNDVITNISTNTTPNVCITYPDHIATYLTGKDTMVSLDKLIDDKNYGLGGKLLPFDGPSKDEVISEFLQECKIGNNYYALPYMRSSEAVYINKDFVEKLGYEIPDVLTWDFIWEVSEKAVTKDSDDNYLLNGQKTLIPFIYKSTDNMMISMLKQYGIDYSSDSGDVLMFNDKTNELLKEIGVHAKSGAFSTFKIASYPANYLNAGQCIFAIDSTAGATWMGADAPLIDIPEEDIVEFETVVKPIPQYDVSKPYMISQGPSICLFNKQDPQVVLASWLFAQFLLTNDVQCAYSKTEGYIPVTEKALSSKEYTDYLNSKGSDNNEHYSVKIDASELLINNTNNTFVTPVFNGSASLRIAAGQLIEETCKAVKRKKTVDDEFVKNLYGDMISLYRLDQTGQINMKTDLGPLPTESKVLLGSLVVAWILIGCYFVYSKTKNRS